MSRVGPTTKEDRMLWRNMALLTADAFAPPATGTPLLEAVGYVGGVPLPDVDLALDLQLRRTTRHLLPTLLASLCRIIPGEAERDVTLGALGEQGDLWREDLRRLRVTVEVPYRIVGVVIIRDEGRQPHRVHRVLRSLAIALSADRLQRWHYAYSLSHLYHGLFLQHDRST